MVVYKNTCNMEIIKPFDKQMFVNVIDSPTNLRKKLPAFLMPGSFK